MLSSKTLAFLALLLALLLLGLRYADRHLAGTADASAPPLALLTADPGRIDELSISLGTFQVDLRRDRGGWLFVDGSGRNYAGDNWASNVQYFGGYTTTDAIPLVYGSASNLYKHSATASKDTPINATGKLVQ